MNLFDMKSKQKNIEVVNYDDLPYYSPGNSTSQKYSNLTNTSPRPGSTRVMASRYIIITLHKMSSDFWEEVIALFPISLI